MGRSVPSVVFLPSIVAYPLLDDAGRMARIVGAGSMVREATWRG
jgi:hypothetical protein